MLIDEDKIIHLYIKNKYNLAIAVIIVILAIGEWRKEDKYQYLPPLQ